MIGWWGAAWAGSAEVDAARAALGDLPYAVEVSSIVHRPTGTRVALRPIVDGHAARDVVVVRLDPAGRAVEVHGEPPRTVVRGEPIPREAAALRVGWRPGAAPVPADLSWQTVDGELRQVWTVRRAERAPVPGRPLGLEVRVDALTGRVLSARDPVWTASPRALAYDVDPLVDDAPMFVELPVDDALSDALVTVLQCRDLGEVEVVSTALGDLPARRCTEGPATGPVHGDFVFPPVPWPDDPARDEDDFAAPHTLWSVHRAAAWFEGLGWTLPAQFPTHVTVTVNYRSADPWSLDTLGDPSAPLLPFDNAYFYGGDRASDGWTPLVMVFGQGFAGDYAYSAEVIHHEFGHLVVASQEGPVYSRDTSYGPSFRGGALNEGLSDYFSAALHGSSAIGEYLGAAAGEPAIRDLAGDATCAADLNGEPHDDSLPLTQGLWELRETLDPSDQALLDAAVLDSLSIVGSEADFPDAVDAIGALVDESLGPARAAELATAWERHGVLDCPPIREVSPGPEPFLAYTLVQAASPWSVAKEVPGYLQLLVQVPDGGAELVLRLTQAEFLGVDLYGDAVPRDLRVVGRSGSRLRWTRDEVDSAIELDGETVHTTVTDWVSDGETLGTPVEVGARLSDDGRTRYHDYELRWSVAEGGPFAFQLVNTRDRWAVPTDLQLDLTPAESTAPPSTEPPSATGAEPPRRAGGGSGCGCAGAGARGGLSLAILLAASLRRRARAG